MAQLEYFVVDVFSDSALAGNPLAVVMNTVGLSTDRMQAIAREFNLSETTFVERRTPEAEREHGVRVRIFTTQEELQFAGHPTLGTASVLKLVAPEAVREGVVTLAENVGPIPVRLGTNDVDFGAGAGLFAEMTQRDPEFGQELDRAEVARLIGLREEDLDQATAPQVVSTGAAFAVVLLRSVEPLGRLEVLQKESAGWLRSLGARWFYILAPAAGASAKVQDREVSRCFRARMQFNGGEDPATGSAAGCAISYLVQQKIVLPGEPAVFRQGVEIGRPSEIFVSANVREAGVGDVRVGGSTVLVARGSLFLP
ncbi:MAG TPA: PhzF family phenazine biosynthesis protein [Terracidiphilus sp.]|nr:PhzF family phenazine biosynthesis protein [Terracidiphilus sp.]